MSVLRILQLGRLEHTARQPPNRPTMIREAPAQVRGMRNHA